MILAIAGSGTIVKESLPVFNELEVAVDALCTTEKSFDDALSLQGKYNINHILTDYDHMLYMTAADTVYIGIPAKLHYAYAMKAIAAGKNVIIEKPMVSNSKQAADLICTAKKSGVFLFEAVTTLYLPSYNKIKELLTEIGDIRIVECNYSLHSPRQRNRNTGTLIKGYSSEQENGALTDINLYNIHFVTGLFGKPANIKYFTSVNNGIDLSGVLVLQYGNIQAICTASCDSFGDPYCYIQGSRGTIIQKQPANRATTVTLKPINGSSETFEDGSGHHRLYPQFETFKKEIDSGDTQNCYQTLEHTQLVIDLMTHARISSGIHYPSDDTVNIFAGGRDNARH